MKMVLPDEVMKHTTELSMVIGVLQAVGEKLPSIKELTDKRIDGCNATIDYLMSTIPHVITFDEAVQVEGEVWYEFKNGGRGWCDLVYDVNSVLAVYTTHGIYIVNPAMYGKKWRVWSDVPSDELRKSKEWEKEGGEE